MAKQIGNGTGRVAPDVALLYRLDSPRPIPARALPAPHLDLMSPSDIKAISRALAIFFPPASTANDRGESLYAVRFFRDRAEITVNVDPGLGAHCTIPDLVAHISAINKWLAEWSGSPRRSPTLDPPWALAMGFAGPAILAIADGIAYHLASPEETTIMVRDTAMREGILCIPARAQLRARASSTCKSTRETEVARVETVVTAVTPGGEKVLLYAKGAAPPATPSVKLDPTTFRRTSVSVPRRIEVLHSHHRPGEPYHE